LVGVWDYLGNIKGWMNGKNYVDVDAFMDLCIMNNAYHIILDPAFMEIVEYKRGMNRIKSHVFSALFLTFRRKGINKYIGYRVVDLLF
jgi:hypothetical protein